jgi:hypothetical protein
MKDDKLTGLFVRPDPGLGRKAERIVAQVLYFLIIG